MARGGTKACDRSPLYAASEGSSETATARPRVSGRAPGWWGWWFVPLCEQPKSTHAEWFNGDLLCVANVLKFRNFFCNDKARVCVCVCVCLSKRSPLPRHRSKPLLAVFSSMTFPHFWRVLNNWSVYAQTRGRNMKRTTQKNKEKPPGRGIQMHIQTSTHPLDSVHANAHAPQTLVQAAALTLELFNLL